MRLQFEPLPLPAGDNLLFQDPTNDLYFKRGLLHWYFLWHQQGKGPTVTLLYLLLIFSPLSRWYQGQVGDYCGQGQAPAVKISMPQFSRCSHSNSLAPCPSVKRYVCDLWCDTTCDVKQHVTWHVACDVTWHVKWYVMWHDMTCNVTYDMWHAILVGHDMWCDLWWEILQ